MPQRFVVANESQEQVLRQMLGPARHSDIVRAWEHGGVEGAIKAAEQALDADGVIPWPVRNLPTHRLDLIAEMRKLAALLEAGEQEYDPETAAQIILKLYDQFV